MGQAMSLIPEKQRGEHMGELYNPFPKLPKNIRQIGETDQVVRFYMEDYVNTYLKRLHPTGKKTMRVGVLLGSVEQYDGTPYIFVDGAMEMEDVETDGEKIIFSESSWKKVYRQMEDSFPKRTIQGWFLCGGPSSQLSPLNYWKQHGQYFAGKNQLMYLNHGLEGEEAIYITSEDGFYHLKGHCIYYERNQMMQDYMVTRKDVHRVESGAQETVIRDFRARLTAKKEQASIYSRATQAMGILCGVLTVAVLAGGVVLVNNYSKMQRMESVLTSVLPAGMESWSEYKKEKADDLDFMIEEIKGNIKPTEAAGETGESYHAETAAENLSAEPGNTGADLAGLQDADAVAVEGEIVSGSADTGQDVPINSGEIKTAPAETKSVSAREEKSVSAGGYRIYEVGRGETLYGICWKTYGSLEHLEEICSLNQLTDLDRILAGQKLLLP